MKHFKSFIFSVSRETNSNEINLSNTNRIMETLDTLEISFRLLKGSYTYSNGETYRETSIKVDHVDRYTHSLLLDLASYYRQESVLRVDHNGKASLYYLEGGEIIQLGKWKKSDEKTALGLGNYSLDKETKQYYVVS